MARKHKGRDISGWVVVNKPAGATSTSMVGKVRWAFDARKAGHAGTLDPAATGVLAIALGEATKTIPYVTDARKAYRFIVRLGQATDTDDAEGTCLATSDQRPSDDTLREALGQFVGRIQQVPPRFSAVKIAGERAYARARNGEDFELSARPLWVEELTMVDRPDEDHVVLHMVCGKGGYVRSIARDLGEALGCHGHVKTLHRIWSGPFTLDNAMTPDDLDRLARHEALEAYLQPLEKGLSSLPRMICNESDASRLRHGNPASVHAIAPDGMPEYGDECWAVCQGSPVALGRYRGGLMHPTRVFACHDHAGFADATEA
ncbi:MAG: tRNA pseudouridine(55) synthase TruB [Pseudomonadota bacterium]